MWENELADMLEAGAMAREKILEVYHRPFDIEIKSDNSPVTEADKAADRIIFSYLKGKYPTYAFLTEESEDDKERLKNDFCFIVDPVDGTKDFCARNDEFATNIALAYKHEIVVGVIFLPSLGDVYYAIKNQGAYHLKNGVVKRIHVNNKKNNLTLYTSRFHSSDFEKQIPTLDSRITKVEPHGSSLKACYIAEGLGEIHYRTNEGTKEWDIAPIDLLIKEAGGVFIKPNGESYTYNRDDVYNHEGYIIANCIENIYRK